MRTLSLVAITVVLCAAVGSYAQTRPASQGRTYQAAGGTKLRLMLDESNLGPEASLGELTFPPNSDSGEHTHGAIEMFYVVTGELEHVVNGSSQLLKPGMAGFVKPPDRVTHKTGPAGATAVVVWVPGEEGRRLASRWKPVE